MKKNNSSATTTKVEVEILDKTYTFNCLEHERDDLQKVANYLNNKMLEIKRLRKDYNIETLAIITALQITHQMLFGQKNNIDNSEINNKINSLIRRIDDALNTIY